MINLHMLSSTLLQSIEISADDLLRNQGASPSILRTRRPEIISLAENAIRLGKKYLQPSVWKKIFAVSAFCHDKILLENDISLKSEYLCGKLIGAYKVALAIGTLGNPLDAEIHKITKEDPALGCLLDSFGSIYSEFLGEWVMNQIREVAKAESLSTSTALFPGNANWPLQEGQRQIFSILAPDPELIALTPNDQMVPQKSFSFIMGLGCAQENGSPCELCEKRDSCTMRH
jgi:hypothetical protein